MVSSLLTLGLAPCPILSLLPCLSSASSLRACPFASPCSCRFGSSSLVILSATIAGSTAVTMVVHAAAPILNTSLPASSSGYTLSLFTSPIKLTPITQYPNTATGFTPTLSLIRPHSGHATSARSSSANERVPIASPTPFVCPMMSVTTNDMLLLRKTRKAMLKSAIPRRYVVAWSRVAVSLGKMRGIVAMLSRRISRARRQARLSWQAFRVVSLDIVTLRSALRSPPL